MTNEEHLQISNIIAYRERRLSEEDHTMAARHLLRCADCRDRLPLPTPDEFWTCVTGGGEQFTETTGWASTWSAIKESFAAFRQPVVRNAVFAGLLLFGVIGLSLLLMTPQGPSENDMLIAAAGDNPSRETIHSERHGEPIRTGTADSDVSGSSPDSNTRHSKATDTRPAKPAQVPDRQFSRKQAVRPRSRPRPPQVAESRGQSQCGGQQTVGLSVKQTDEGLLLRWDRVPGAVLYNVYLSDLDERLVDSFETADETSYLVKAELVKETIYRLRLIATLKSDERIVSESRNFKVSDLTLESKSVGNIGSGRRTSATVRCAEVKQ
ncbi:MAG: hypothetical protein KF855_13770 [Acidobacteria bacterium]|nr:hypothetical protein [Acidobacteriota bacterium]